MRTIGQPPGGDEPDDQHRREDQKGDIEPGGVVPRRPVRDRPGPPSRLPELVGTRIGNSWFDLRKRGMSGFGSCY